ncbi:sensor histidine kinase KdpD, partial [uncultured Cetobacterium sp.]
SIKQLEEFISNVSHELKTPISIISSNIQLLMNEKKIDLITEEKYKNILKESYYTKILIEKLMRLSKLENQKKIEYKFINLNKIIEEILERYDYIELAKNLEIKLDTLKNKYFINEDMFRIALDNIILNSMKYSKDNGILKIYEKDKTLFFENEILKEFSLDNLFNPFVRGSNSSREDGTGLGLTLIKKILELNNINYGIELKNKKFIFWIK